jgi:hypothetical protein
MSKIVVVVSFEVFALGDCQKPRKISDLHVGPPEFKAEILT